MAKDAPVPNIIAQTFMSAFKVFLIIYLATIFVLAVIWYKPTQPHAGGDARVEINQNGNDNIHQEINN